MSQSHIRGGPRTAAPLRAGGLTAVPGRRGRAAPPFADQPPPPADTPALEALPNASSRVEHRVTRELLQAEIAALGSGPCRVVVSGPAGFNGAVKEMLAQCGTDMEMVTILSA